MRILTVMAGVAVVAWSVGALSTGDTQASPPSTSFPPAEQGSQTLTEAAPATGESVAFSVQDCAGCHDSQISGFRGGPHAILETDPAWSNHFGSTGCESCHGDPSAHMDSGGEAGNLFAFLESDSALARTAVCESCHGDTHPNFPRTRHAAAGLSCDSCHSIHQGQGGSLLAAGTGLPEFGRMGRASATCAECHGDVLAQFAQTEHHRLETGTIGCESCHDPHAPRTQLALGGFQQESCVSCHGDKGGPFVFEHGAQRVEGCVACHQPHGSPNRHMLTFQAVADLCYSCHAVVPGFHTRFTADTVCTNCHSTIHGSNFDPAFLK